MITVIKLKASPYTKLFWIEYGLSPGRTDYSIVFDQTIHGALDHAKLSQALCHLVQDHILLNSHLVEEGGQLFWHTNDHIALLEQMDDTEDNRLLFVKRPFNLTTGPLYRFGLFRTNHEESRFIVVLHHALLDGRMFVEFTQLVSQYYNHPRPKSCLVKQEKNIRRVNDQLSFIVGQCKAQESQKFWLDYFSDLDLTNELRCTKIPSPDKLCLGELTFSVDKSILAPHVDSGAYTPFQIFSLIWGVLIAKHNASNQSFLTYPIGIKEADAFIYGGQINTLVLKTVFNCDDTWLDLLGINQAFVKSIRSSSGSKHSYLPTHDLLTLSKNKQLDIGFAQTTLKDENCQFKFGHCASHIHHDYNLDLGGLKIACQYEEREADYHFKINYRSDLFTKESMESIQTQYQHLIRQFTDSPNQPIAAIGLLPQQAYQQIVYDWNQTDIDYPKDKTLHQLFEEQVVRTPNSIAVVFEDTRITYQVLNQQANQVARYITQQLKVKKAQRPRDTLVALCFDRSLEMVIAVLGVLKAGGAYVPIDPHYPDERIQHILSDTNSPLLLTQTHLTERLKSVNLAGVQMIMLDDKPYQYEKKTHFSSRNSATDLAYVIYTSGTTGASKGVMLAHRGLVSLAFSKRKQLPLLSTHEKIGQIAAFTFDTSCLDYALALINGYELHILSQIVRHDVSQIAGYIARNEITFIDMPTMLYEHFQPEDVQQLKTLKYLEMGGEKLGCVVDNAGLTYHLVNGYGPTECTVESSLAIYSPETQYLALAQSSIGQAVCNTRLYVLDAYLNPVPIGVMGELYIGGVGLARGYLNRPELTAERFIDNPFATEEDKAQGYTKLYKTGDLVRWLPEGRVEYVGRNDFQVKIRGFRIELSEIEHALSKHEAIKQNLILAKERHTPAGVTKYLAAFYISDVALDESVLRDYLSNLLPEYMVPSAFIHLSAFPLTANDKVDRNALPEPNFHADEASSVAPTTPLEVMLCESWQEILGLERVGVLDDFFRIGGDSILSIQLASLLRQKNIYCSVKDIFEHRCIERLARCLEQTNKQMNTSGLDNTLTSMEDCTIISPSLFSRLQTRYDIEAIYPMNSLQRYFVDQVLNQPNREDPYQGHTVFDYHYPLDVVCYQQAWSLAIQTYPALRTCFNWEEEMIQIICKQGHLDFTVHDICSEENKDRAIELIQQQDLLKPLDLAQPSLLRLHFIKCSEMHYTVVQFDHHTITDGWSSSVLLNQVHDYYYQLTHQQVPQINEDKAYFRAQSYMDKYQQSAQLYWATAFNKIRPGKGLVEDKPASGKLFKMTFEVKGEHYHALKTLVKKEGITFNVLVQYAWHKLIHEQTKSSQTIVGATVSGRMIPVLGIADSVGCYINCLPLILDWDDGVTLQTQLQQIHGKITEINDHSFADFMTLDNLNQVRFCSEMVFQNYPDATDSPGRLHAVLRAYGEKIIDTPLVLLAFVRSDVLHIHFKRDQAYLTDAGAKRLFNQFKSILLGLVKEPSSAVCFGP